MSIRSTACAALVAMACGFASTSLVSRAGDVHRPRDVAEFDQMFKEVSNWGRWGKTDELGTANLITDAKRRQAAALVKLGTAVSLSHQLMTEKADDNPNPFEL